MRLNSAYISEQSNSEFIKAYASKSLTYWSIISSLDAFCINCNTISLKSSNWSNGGFDMYIPFFTVFCFFMSTSLPMV